MYYVYIVECSDFSYYTGFTRDVKKRVWLHNNSKLGAKSTRGKRPVKLVYTERFILKVDAFKREKEIKGWRREKKLELIKSRLRR
jgi:putative endonuclease